MSRRQEDLVVGKLIQFGAKCPFCGVRVPVGSAHALVKGKCVAVNP